MPVNVGDISVVQAMTAGLKVIFQDSYNAALKDSGFDRLATTVPSNGDSEDYSWLGSVPKVREFTSERRPGQLPAYKFSIVNKTWENSISVLRSALEDDKLGMVRVRVQGLGSEAARFRRELVHSIIVWGLGTDTRALGFDSKQLFATDHPIGDTGVTQSNKVDVALSATAIQAGITAMMKFQDDRGRPLGIIPDTLMVPPDLQWTAMELLESTLWPEVSGTAGTVKLANNVLNGKLGLEVSEFMTDTNSWVLYSSKEPVKPVIFQDRIPVEFGSLEAESEAGFMRDEFIYGTRQRCNAGAGFWPACYGSTGGS